MKKEHGGNVYKISRETGLEISEIIDFSANINPLGVPESGKKAIEESISGLVNYPDPDYIGFRQVIAEHHGLDYHMIYPGNGAIDSLFSAVAAVEPNRVLVSVPSFVEYEKAVLKAGAEYVPAYRKEEDGYRFDTEDFLGKLTEDIDLAVICNPNNPTGDLVAYDDVLKIVKRCREIGAYLLLDEAFMEFAEHFGAKSAIDLIPDYKELIVSRSLTKYFAVPGLRAGYLVVGDTCIAQRLQNAAEPWKLNHLADNFSRVVVNDEAYIQQTGDWIVKENAYLYAALCDLKSIEVFKSFANYMLIHCLSAVDLKSALLEKGIMIRTCHNYDGMETNYYRVAVKDSVSNQKLIEALKDVLAN